MKSPTDGCPTWANTDIARIREFEVQLGNINPPGDWQQADLTTIHQRIYGGATAGSGDDIEQTVEALFRKVCKGLIDDGFEPERIAAFVNARVVSGGRLVYCNAQEVAEAL